MRNRAVKWALVMSLGLGLTTYAQDKNGGKLLEWQFAGTKALANSKEAKTIAEVVRLPESAAFRDAAVNHLSRLAAARFARTHATNPAAMGAAKLIAPLLTDLIENESRFEMTARQNSANWILAVKAPEDRAQVWSSNLWKLAVSSKLGTPSQATIDGRSGWNAERDGYHVAFSSGKGWMVMQGGYTPIAQQAAIFKDFRKDLGKKQGKELLELEANLGLMGKIWSSEKLSHGPKISIETEPKGGGLRTVTELEYPQDLGIKPEKWNPPVETIRDPIMNHRPTLIGFTAVQGIARPLSTSPLFKSLEAEQTPNQAYFWANSMSPFSLFGAANVGNPAVVISNVVSKIIPKLQERAGNRLFGNLQFNTNTGAMTWRGLPIVVPFLEPAAQPESNYLVGGLFPVVQGTNKAPRELYAELNKKNLIYYDWEVSQVRVDQWRPVLQLGSIVQGRKLGSPDSAMANWLEAVAPKLGNTVTEGTLEGSKKIKLVRQSQLGFTAFELVALAKWLGEEPVEPRRAKRPPAKGLPTAPAPGQP